MTRVVVIQTRAGGGSHVTGKPRAAEKQKHVVEIQPRVVETQPRVAGDRD